MYIPNFATSADSNQVSPPRAQLNSAAFLPEMIESCENQQLNYAPMPLFPFPPPPRGIFPPPSWNINVPYGHYNTVPIRPNDLMGFSRFPPIPPSMPPPSPMGFFSNAQYTTIPQSPAVLGTTKESKQVIRNFLINLESNSLAEFEEPVHLQSNESLNDLEQDSPTSSYSLEKRSTSTNDIESERLRERKSRWDQHNDVNKRHRTPSIQKVNNDMLVRSDSPSNCQSSSSLDRFSKESLLKERLLKKQSLSSLLKGIKSVRDSRLGRSKDRKHERQSRDSSPSNSKKSRTDSSRPAHYEKLRGSSVTKIRSEVHLVEKKSNQKRKEQTSSSRAKKKDHAEIRSEVYIVEKENSQDKMSNSKSRRKRRKKREAQDKQNGNAARLNNLLKKNDEPSTSTQVLKEVCFEVRSVKAKEKSRDEDRAVKMDSLGSVHLTRTIVNDHVVKSTPKSNSPPPMSVIIIDDEENEIDDTASNDLEEIESRPDSPLPQQETPDSIQILNDDSSESAVISPEPTDEIQVLEKEREELNWRCRAMFNGRVRIDDLPPNCRRPQTSTGRTFPMKTISENNSLSDYLSPNACSTSLSPRVDLSSPNIILNNQSTRVISTAYVKKKFTNRSLRIIGERRIYNDSDECFQFAKDKKCNAESFCIYSHNGDKSHQEKKFCLRLLQGKCRYDTKCLNGEHGLEKHQMPVCDFYLRMICSHRDCQYLHVKHAEFEQPCPNFQKGQCFNGIMCDKPHRYIYSIVKARGQINSDSSTEDSLTASVESGNDLRYLFLKMPRVSGGMERSRSNSNSGSDSEEEKPLASTRQRRTASAKTASAWAALVPAKKGHDDEDDKDETIEEDRVERKRPALNSGSVARPTRNTRTRKTASPASKKEDTDVKVDPSAAVVVTRVDSPRTTAIKRTEPSIMDQKQLNAIEKETDKHLAEAERIEKANEEFDDDELESLKNGDNDSDEWEPEPKPRSALKSTPGRGRGRGGRGGGTPGRGGRGGRGAGGGRGGRGGGITIPALPGMPGSRGAMPSRVGMPPSRMPMPYGGQPGMQNGDGKPPLKILRLKTGGGGPAIPVSNAQVANLPAKPVVTAPVQTTTVPSTFSKEVEELSAKLTGKNVPGATVNEFVQLVNQLQQELARVTDDRQKIIANNREYVDQMQLSHATALDIKDSRIRLLEANVDKLQVNYDNALKRIQLLLLRGEAGGVSKELAGHSASPDKLDQAVKEPPKPQRLNISQIISDGKPNPPVNANLKPALAAQKHPASTSSFSNAEEPPVKRANVQSFRVTLPGQQRTIQIHDSRLAAKERLEMGEESDSEPKDELEDEEFEEEDQYDAIMETQRQLYESGLP